MSFNQGGDMYGFSYFVLKTTYSVKYLGLEVQVIM